MPSLDFSEAVFPVDISYGATSTPRINVSVETTEAGFERRTLKWRGALREYDVATGITQMCRDDEDEAQKHLGQLITFWHVMDGPLTGFLFKDWSDYSSAPDHISEPRPDDVLIGIGDGVKSVFNLVKIYDVPGSGKDPKIRRIHKPATGSVAVRVGGVELTADQYSVDTVVGRIALSTPPGVGVPVQAGFEFFVPARFSTGTLPVRLDAYQAGSATVEIKELRLDLDA